MNDISEESPRNDDDDIIIRKTKKAPIKIEDESMKNEAMDTSQIEHFVFSTSAAFTLSTSTDTKLSYDRHQNSRLSSRQGRATQRWEYDHHNDDNNHNEPIRLVTGCVPILQGGRILLASSSRQKDWILPKGGWENDETIEQSAGREAYEEAGVVGILGKPLPEIKYETRKSKNRKMKLKQTAQTPTPHSQMTPQLNPPNTTLQQQPSPPTSPQKKATKKCPPNGEKHYSWVKMRLFPLYVTEISAKWPESDRLRRVVPIDTAIQLLDSRQEFKTSLLNLKQRNNYHSPPPSSEQVQQQQSDAVNHEGS